MARTTCAPPGSTCNSPAVSVNWFYRSMARIHAATLAGDNIGVVQAPGTRQTPEVASPEIWNTNLLGVSGVVTVVWVMLLTITGPGSFDYALTPLQRLAFFVAVGVLSWPVGHALAATLLHIVRLRSAAVIGLTAIAVGLYVAANVAAVAFALDKLFVPAAPDEFSLATIYLLCAAIVVPHVGLVYFLAWQRAQLKLSRAQALATVDPNPTAAAHQPAQPPAPSEPLPGAEPHARFLNRLPEELGRDLVYIKGMGHYLDVVTTSGSGTLLMRFADAILELGDTGLRAHRSYWVARRHITGLARRDGHTVIRLTSGDEVPVSRTYRAGVSAAKASRTAPNHGAQRGKRSSH